MVVSNPAEHIALGSTGVEHYSGGAVTPNPNCLASVCEEVQYPVAEGGTQAQSAKFVNQFHCFFEIVLNAELKSTNIPM